MTYAGKELGRRGEAMAAAELEKRGYDIISRNYRAAGGEIDIVAQKAGKIYFVEVKSRRGTKFGLPAEAVTAAKRKKIAETALAFLGSRNEDAECGFLVAAVYYDTKKVELINDSLY